jgi:microcystin-dependent protein
MTEPFMGAIQYLGFSFAPRGWVPCDGQTLNISQYSALYSLLGVTYGGDGTTTFAVPDLRGRVPIHRGQASGGGSLYNPGQTGGTETVTLSVNQMPSHTHAGSLAANNVKATSAAPQAGFQLGRGVDGDGDPSAIPFIYAPAAATNQVSLAGVNVAAAGGSQPHENRQPYTVIFAAIAVQGIYPSRN